jgi:hypothetical protein
MALFCNKLTIPRNVPISLGDYLEIAAIQISRDSIRKLHYDVLTFEHQIPTPLTNLQAGLIQRHIDPTGQSA